MYFQEVDWRTQSLITCGTGGSELLYKFSPQQTWNSDSQSFVVDKTVIERGDPDSPQLSFSGVEIARQHAGFLPSPLYKAIICSAAVKLSDGTCRPWTKEDPLVGHAFPPV